MARALIDLCAARCSENERTREAALDSIRNDPGLQQLVPYFVQFAVDTTATNSKNLPVLSSMMRLMQALLENKNLFVEPYVCA
jgi:transcription initiation factor TFIID subunit 6